MIKKEEQEQHLHLDSLDKSLQAALGKITHGISPAALLLAFSDWYLHLLIQPGKQIQLAELYNKNLLKLFQQYWEKLSVNPLHENSSKPHDKRFAGEPWQQFPYSFWYESFLLMQNWWHVAATDVRGVSQHHEEVVDFTLRQILDMLSPSNYIFSNPEILQASIDSQGQNFVNGFENFLDDTQRNLSGKPPAGAENFVVGETLALTKGKVVFKNRLIELIQYKPTTQEVYAEPILITPAWIMKYYILDLTPKHSLVNYLVSKGHTVFMISWKNPDKNDKDLSLDDYLKSGIFAALDVVSIILPERKVHLMGYCLGGTLTAIAVAALARDKDKRVASMILLAAQTDFTEPGELSLFIDESQISFLESMMAEKGYLDTHQMAGAFQLMRSNDLIWSRLIHDYLLGNRKPLTDLMAWNADATRMPYKMHSEYLRKLFLDNELAEGKFLVDNKPIVLADIKLPIFVVATERDHVSPWHSVFKINLLTRGDITFVLTSGGHNVGIVSLPSKTTKRHYRIANLQKHEQSIHADNWYRLVQPVNGSWWPALEKWLSEHSTQKVSPPHMGLPGSILSELENAPGEYVLEK